MSFESVDVVGIGYKEPVFDVSTPFLLMCQCLDHFDLSLFGINL